MLPRWSPNLCARRPSGTRGVLDAAGVLGVLGVLGVAGVRGVTRTRRLRRDRGARRGRRDLRDLGARGVLRRLDKKPLHQSMQTRLHVAIIGYVGGVGPVIIQVIA